jgi:hypothetical protein
VSIEVQLFELLRERIIQAIDFFDLGAIYSKVLVPLVGLPKDGPVERIFDLTQ